MNPFWKRKGMGGTVFEPTERTNMSPCALMPVGSPLLPLIVPAGTTLYFYWRRLALERGGRDQPGHHHGRTADRGMSVKSHEQAFNRGLNERRLTKFF